MTSCPALVFVIVDIVTVLMHVLTAYIIVVIILLVASLIYAVMDVVYAAYSKTSGHTRPVDRALEPLCWKIIDVTVYVSKIVCVYVSVLCLPTTSYAKRRGIPLHRPFSCRLSKFMTYNTYTTSQHCCCCCCSSVDIINIYSSKDKIICRIYITQCNTTQVLWWRYVVTALFTLHIEKQ